MLIIQRTEQPVAFGTHGEAMTQQARQDILKKLTSAPKVETKARPIIPPLPDLSLKREELVVRFTENLTEQTGVLYRVKDADEVKAKLKEIAVGENLKTVMVSTDPVITPLNLPAWGRGVGIEVLTASNFTDREAYREAVFNKVQAGVTGADYAVAESGSICLIHDQDQPRLISIAPILHIAVLLIERLFPVYENVMDRVYTGPENLPSHFTLITGPSMTADIQGGQFKGMHGPGKLIVILIG